jgi:RES domain
MNCCAECFGDRGIRRSLIPMHSTGTGRCSYCESDNVAVVAPAELAEYFKLLVSAYRLDPTGRILVHWFREDWALFKHPRMDDSRAKDLLAEILNDGEIVRQTFAHVNDAAVDRLSEWEKFRDELMYHNRYFPEGTIDLDRLESLLSYLTLDPDEIPTQWYRARLQPGETAFTPPEMGAPPRRITSHGRANPAGIPYLYLGSDPTATISEIRPHTGEVACVADFTTPTDLKVIDLRSPRNLVSPFLLEDATDIGKMRSDLPFLERVGEELTRPVIPEAAAIDYIPSQYLCEFIKNKGYQGGDLQEFDQHRHQLSPLLPCARDLRDRQAISSHAGGSRDCCWIASSAIIPPKFLSSPFPLDSFAQPLPPSVTSTIPPIAENFPHRAHNRTSAQSELKSSARTADPTESRKCGTSPSPSTTRSTPAPASGPPNTTPQSLPSSSTCSPPSAPTGAPKTSSPPGSATPTTAAPSPHPCPPSNPSPPPHPLR